MTLRGLIIGIAVCLLVEAIALFGWHQLGRNLQSEFVYDTFSPDTKMFYSPDTPSGDGSYAYPMNPGYTDYSKDIKAAVAAIKSEKERVAVDQIFDELEKKTYREIVDLKVASNVCQEIACGALSSNTAHQAVENYYDMRIAVDAHNTAMRNAAAAERSSFIAFASATIAFFALTVSGLSFRLAHRGARSALAT